MGARLVVGTARVNELASWEENSVGARMVPSRQTGICEKSDAVIAIDTLRVWDATTIVNTCDANKLHHWTSDERAGSLLMEPCLGLQSAHLASGRR